MRILHLSDTPLSGSPISIMEITNKYTEHKAKHIVWDNVVRGHSWRRYRNDLIGSTMTKEELHHWLNWATHLHFHNRWKRQNIFKHLGIDPPKKPSVIQIHSPRESEDFSEEVVSGLPLAILAQYHVRQWTNELTYIVPNPVDINHEEFKRETPPLRPMPVVSYAPSNATGKGYDDKSYGIVSPVLKRMKLAHEIYYQLIWQQSFEKAMEMKRNADIAVDEISTGSYHRSSLEYLALGIPTFANIDRLTFDVLRNMTGCERLPWIIANKLSFKQELDKIIREKSWQELGQQSKDWMSRYWNPDFLAKQYVDVYEDL